MRSWMIAACFCLAVASVTGAQDDEAAKANALYISGKKLEALPLYENLTKVQPKEYLYFERLADCLGAESMQLNEGAEFVQVRTRMRDAAKRAVELGDQAEFMRMIANIDPTKPIDTAAS